MLFDICLIIFSILFMVLFYFKVSFEYWKSRNIPSPKARIPFGTQENVFKLKDPGYIQLKKFYDKFKALGHKHFGIFAFTTPIYVPIDLDIIKHILTKDFSYFVNRGIYSNEIDEPLFGQLFNLEGLKWKYLRSKLVFTFTVNKLKAMFPTLVTTGQQLKEALEVQSQKGEPVNIAEVSADFINDVIGGCAFGIECNSFKNPDSGFRRCGEKICSPDRKTFYKMYFAYNFPTIFQKFHIRLGEKEIEDFFVEITKKIVANREKGNVQNDFMQLLVKLKDVNHELTITEIAAECFIFYLAGFSSSPFIMTFCLYEIAKHPYIQDKARNEITAVLQAHNGEINYETIKEMKYLDQIIDETLRKYTPLPLLQRKCFRDYKIPGTDIILPKGCDVIIPTYALHADPELYPEPDKFNPDRFSEVEVANRHSYAHIPYGEGQRKCIGERFANMIVKVGLCSVLSNFKLSLNANTPNTFTWNPYNVLLQVKETILLNVEKIH